LITLPGSIEVDISVPAVKLALLLPDIVTVPARTETEEVPRFLAVVKSAVFQLIPDREAVSVDDILVLFSLTERLHKVR
jgi:hypothetical protein